MNYEHSESFVDADKLLVKPIFQNLAMWNGMKRHLYNCQTNTGLENHPLFDKDGVLHGLVHDFHLDIPVNKTKYFYKNIINVIYKIHTYKKKNIFN